MCPKTLTSRILILGYIRRYPFVAPTNMATATTMVKEVVSHDHDHTLSCGVLWFMLVVLYGIGIVKNLQRLDNWTMTEWPQSCLRDTVQNVMNSIYNLVWACAMFNQSACWSCQYLYTMICRILGMEPWASTDGKTQINARVCFHFSYKQKTRLQKKCLSWVSWFSGCLNWISPFSNHVLVGSHRHFFHQVGGNCSKNRLKPVLPVGLLHPLHPGCRLKFIRVSCLEYTIYHIWYCNFCNMYLYFIQYYVLHTVCLISLNS